MHSTTCRHNRGVPNGEDEIILQGVNLTTFLPCKHSEPAKSISLCKCPGFPTNTTFIFVWSYSDGVEVTRLRKQRGQSRTRQFPLGDHQSRLQGVEVVVPRKQHTSTRTTESTTKDTVRLRERTHREEHQDSDGRKRSTTHHLNTQLESNPVQKENNVRPSRGQNLCVGHCSQMRRHAHRVSPEGTKTRHTATRHRYANN